MYFLSSMRGDFQLSSAIVTLNEPLNVPLNADLNEIPIWRGLLHNWANDWYSTTLKFHDLEGFDQFVWKSLVCKVWTVGTYNSASVFFGLAFVEKLLAIYENKELKITRSCGQRTRGPLLDRLNTTKSNLIGLSRDCSLF